MSRTVCKLISLLTAVLLLLGSLAGCGGNESEITDKQYQKLFDKGIVIENNVSIDTIKKTETDTRNISYLRIDGLSDKNTQNKINRRIYEIMEDMLRTDFIPPYRGIALSLKKYGHSVKSIRLSFTQGFNCNNILSLYACCDVSYEVNELSHDIDYFVYSYNVPLTFDLTNGEELALSDIFIDNADYIELINQGVDQCLLSGGFDGSPNEYGFYTAISMVSPFKTIKPDQKYYIDDDGDICLCIDYDTPEFYTGANYPIWLRLNSNQFEHSLKLYRTTDHPLFDSEAVNCRFMFNSDFKNARPKEKTGKGINYYSTLRYLSGTPKKVQKLGRTIAFEETMSPVSIKEFKKQAVNTLGKKYPIDYYFYLETEPSYIKSQDYYSYFQTTLFSASYSEVVVEEGDDVVYPDSFLTSYKKAFCFNRSGEEVVLDSLFTEPYNADALLIAAIQKYLLEVANSEYEFQFSKEDTDELVHNLIPLINGFTLDSDSIDLSYDLSETELNDMIIRYLGLTDRDRRYIDWICTANYSDIGCGNLVFFQDAFAN